jgi:transcriptional regulator with XRE-family HTH domain
MTEATITRDGPHPVDLHVGLRIRNRRRELGLSQGDLARALGITFQQVQKYERGSNRVSASRLLETGAALQTSIAYYFTGIEPGNTDAVEAAGRAAALLADPRMLEVAERLSLLSPPARQEALLAIACFVERLQAFAEVAAPAGFVHPSRAGG